jgi:hypothetical protein
LEGLRDSAEVGYSAEEGTDGGNLAELIEVLANRASEAFVAARSGDYQLLLGAGASFGARNGRGQPLPMAKELIRRLRTQYPAALIEDGNTLHRAYQRAVSEVGNKAVYEYLKSVFGKSNHNAWFTDLASLPWKHVWTLNIDDTFERAFAKGPRSNVTDLRVVDWVDGYSSTDDVQIVHLHGRVSGDDPTPLVFSFTEYMNLAERKPVWDQVLKGLLPTSPFIILGAKCLDDPDVEAALLAARPAHDAPSIIVDPFISAGQKRELTRLGYSIYDGPAEDFVRQWTAYMELDAANLDALYRTTALSLPQFDELQLTSVDDVPQNHDYYGGSEPLWVDAQRQLIADFEWINSETSYAKTWVRNPQRISAARVIFADRLSGLSSGLLRLAHELRSTGATVLWFNRQARFDKKRLLAYARGRGPLVIFCDSAHEFTVYFNELLIAAQSLQDCSILVVFAERNSREMQVDNHLVLDEQHRSTAYVGPRRSRVDAYRIESLLKLHGRLGKLELVDESTRRAHFVRRDIFSAMAEMESEVGFRSRLTRELRALHKGWHKDLLMILALASDGSHQVGVQEAAFAVNVSVTTLMEDIANDSTLNAVVEVAGGLIYARQRTSSLDNLFAPDDYNERLRALAVAINSLSGLATSRSLQEKNRPASLVGGLMQARLLRWVFPGADIDSFYDELFPAFGSWNARFWEQRAINAKLENNWGPAESWASRAVTIKDDPYTRTTLGTILLNKAVVAVGNRDSAWISLYRRGQTELEEALRQDFGNRVASISFLENALTLMRRILSTPDLPGAVDELKAIRADWTRSYAAIQLFGPENDSARRRASRLVRQFDVLFPE